MLSTSFINSEVDYYRLISSAITEVPKTIEKKEALIRDFKKADRRVRC